MSLIQTRRPVYWTQLMLWQSNSTNFAQLVVGRFVMGVRSIYCTNKRQCKVEAQSSGTLYIPDRSLVRNSQFSSKLKTWVAFLLWNTHTHNLHINKYMCWWGNLRERDHWGDPDVDGSVILRCIFRKWEGVVGTGRRWLRIGRGGGHLWVRWGTFGFHKMREISWLAAEPVIFSRGTLLHGVSK